MTFGWLRAAAGVTIMASILIWGVHRSTRNAELIDAVAHHNVPGAQRALAGGADANATEPRIIWNTDPAGRALPLHYRSQPMPAIVMAAYENNAGLVSLLLRHGANPNSSGEYSVLPLSYALLYGNTAMARALFDHDVSRETAGSQSTAVTLVTGGMEICRRNPHSALFAGHDYPGVITLLLARGMNIDARGEDGLTMLAGAARAGDAALVKSLLARNADATIADHTGQTPLFYARRFSHPEIASLLASASTGRKPNRNP